jgi:thiamine biosynthesis lipoprotein
MGTTYQVKITHTTMTEEEITRMRMQVDSTLIEVNRQMSTYDPESEISRFNDYAETDPFPVSPEFAGVVKYAIKVSALSDNLFDITVANLVNIWGFGRKGRREDPPDDKEIATELENVGVEYIQTIDDNRIRKLKPKIRIDLSAIAKGYGVDAVAKVLASHAYLNYMVEIGGEVIARGLNSRGEAWKIGVDNPGLASLPGENIRSILALRDIAVATSGDYRNYFEYKGNLYSHTINPKTGKPVTHNLASATVVAKDCMTADALATALMVMGKEQGLKWIEKIENVEALLITRRSKDTFSSFQSSGFSKYMYK